MTLTQAPNMFYELRLPTFKPTVLDTSINVAFTL